MSGSDANQNRIEIASVEEFKPGDRKIVSKGNQEIGVFNVDGEYHAILNTCLHQNGPICEGKVLPEITGEFTEIGERVEQSYGDNMVLKCPWHGWEYNLESGQLLDDNQMCLPTFEVIVEKDTIYIKL